MDDVLSNRAMEALLSDMSLHVDLLESDLVDDESMLAADCHIDRVDSDLADEFIVKRRGWRGGEEVLQVRSRQESPQSVVPIICFLLLFITYLIIGYIASVASFLRSLDNLRQRTLLLAVRQRSRMSS